MRQGVLLQLSPCGRGLFVLSLRSYVPIYLYDHFQDSARHEIECQPFEKVFDKWQEDVGVLGAPMKGPPSSFSSKSSTKPSSKQTLEPLYSASKSSLKEHDALAMSQSHAQEEVADENMVPISTPSELKANRERNTTRHRKKRKKTREIIEVRAYHFDIDASYPYVSLVQCVVEHSSFSQTYHRPRYHRYVGIDATFNTIPTYRGLFLLIRPSNELIYENALPKNQCISRLTGGADHGWKGNILILKETLPKTDFLTDIEEEDLQVLKSYFKMDGKETCVYTNTCLISS